MPQEPAFRHVPRWYLSPRAFVTVELLSGVPFCRVLDPTVGNIGVDRKTCVNVFKERCAESYHDDCKDTTARRNLTIDNTSFRYISTVCSHSVHAFTIALDSTMVCVDKYKCGQLIMLNGWELVTTFESSASLPK